MSKEFYRFRQLNEHTYDELEQGYFYCAETNELNDPMEGFRSPIFKGDRIVWSNLFRHYFCCLLRTHLLYALSSNTIDLENEFKLNDFVLCNYDGFFKTMLKTKYFNQFIEKCEPIIEKFSSKNEPIKKDELVSYLFFLHMIALNFMQNYMPSKIENICKMLTVKDKNIHIDIISEIKNFLHESTLNINHLTKNNRFILFDFVDTYLNELYKLIYPRLYIVSFSDNPYNSSMWGNYAKNHSGICLIFKSENDKIKLKQFTLKQCKNIELEFIKVKYERAYREFEFFSNLSRYTMPNLMEIWYKNDNNISPIYQTNKIFINDLEKGNYYKNILKSILVKSKDWEYEKEFRLVISSEFNDKLDDRKLFYNFNSLKGIIFGINTNNIEKTKIIELINKKCKCSNDKNFKFYQAYYCYKSDDIRYNEITL